MLFLICGWLNLWMRNLGVQGGWLYIETSPLINGHAAFSTCYLRVKCVCISTSICHLSSIYLSLYLSVYVISLSSVDLSSIYLSTSLSVSIIYPSI